jgi:hypothetical protein
MGIEAIPPYHHASRKRHLRFIPLGKSVQSVSLPPFETVHVLIIWYLSLLQHHIWNRIDCNQKLIDLVGIDSSTLLELIHLLEYPPDCVPYGCPNP